MTTHIARLSVLLLLTATGCKKDKPADTAVDCSARTYSVPSTRGELGGVWDRGRFVFFGGDQGTPVDCVSQPDWVSETWAFHTDCDSFEQLAVGATAPSPRSRYAVAHDATRNRMWMHGGRWRDPDAGSSSPHGGSSAPYELYNDLWAFDLDTDTWTEIDAADGPDPRVSHAMVVVGDQLLVYGGNESTEGLSYEPLGDLWSLDIDTLAWTQITQDAEPGERLFHGYAASADGGSVYIYGGGDELIFNNSIFGDLWKLDVASMTWTELQDGNGEAPAPRFWPNLLVDDEHGRLLLWAGHDNTSLGNTNQLWSFDLGTATWAQVETGDVLNASPYGYCDFPSDFTITDPDAPERRYAGAAALTGNDLIVFGGKTDCGQINDIWTWSLGDGGWSERSAATFGEVCERAFASECESLCF